jgi:hypothetical protein
MLSCLRNYADGPVESLTLSLELSPRVAVLVIVCAGCTINLCATVKTDADNGESVKVMMTMNNQRSPAPSAI